MRSSATSVDVDDGLKEWSCKGDALVRLSAIVGFELFRHELTRAVLRTDRPPRGGPMLKLMHGWVLCHG